MTLFQLSQRLEALRSSFNPDDARSMGALLEQIALWLEDQRTPRELMNALDRILGGSWFSKGEPHGEVHCALEAFRSTVADLGGMTMNERLVMFDLVDRWDQTSERERADLYAKLEAKAK